jgi:hypothetical protein
MSRRRPKLKTLQTYGIVTILHNKTKPPDAGAIVYL